MMFNNNMTAIVHTPDGDNIFFDIVYGFLQGDTLALFLFIICLDYKLWISIALIKENGFIQKQARNRHRPAETTPELSYADAQGERGRGLYVNSDKTEFICLLNSKSPQLAEQFTYLSSNISSTESEVNISISKACSAIDRLSMI